MTAYVKNNNVKLIINNAIFLKKLFRLTGLIALKSPSKLVEDMF